MQIQNSWLLKMPTDLDLQCLQRQCISGFSRTRIKVGRFKSIYGDIMHTFSYENETRVTDLQNSLAQKFLKHQLFSVASTLRRRCINVMCLLAFLLESTGLHFRKQMNFSVYCIMEMLYLNVLDKRAIQMNSYIRA